MFKGRRPTEAAAVPSDFYVENTFVFSTRKLVKVVGSRGNVIESAWTTGYRIIKSPKISVEILDKGNNWVTLYVGGFSAVEC